MGPRGMATKNHFVLLSTKVLLSGAIFLRGVVARASRP